MVPYRPGPTATVRLSGTRAWLLPLAAAFWLLVWTLGCADNSLDTGEQAATATAEPAATVPSEAEAVPEEGPSTYLLLNQKLVEGLRSEVDLEDVDEMFWHIFSRLPDHVTVYPSENYYYFILHVGGRQIWGNIRLAAGRRERGVLSFAYFEYRGSPYVTEPRIQRSKFFTDADGLVIEEIDRFTFRVRYNRRDVVFNLDQLSQELPKSFDLGDGEVLIPS